MGGFGSGIWTRYDAPQTLDTLRRIEITFLKKVGALNSSQHGTLSWTRNGEPNGFVRYQCHPENLELDFSFRCNESDEWQPVNQFISFDTTPCNYGGVRRWFLCPSCDKRVGVLCAAGKLFLCRHCYKAPYSSQNESGLGRLNSKKDKIAKRIFEDYHDGRGRLRKKGMHHKTFDRQYAQYRQLEYQLFVEYDDMFDRIQGYF